MIVSAHNAIDTAANVEHAKNAESAKNNL